MCALESFPKILNTLMRPNTIISRYLVLFAAMYRVAATAYFSRLVWKYILLSMTYAQSAVTQ